MTTITWKTGASGNWTSASRWSPGSVPDASDAVTIGVSGIYTVSLSSPITVQSIDISNPFATLNIEENSGVDKVTGAFKNAGTVDVDTNSGMGGVNLTVGGTFTNTGDLVVGNPSGIQFTKVIVGGFVNSGLVDLIGVGQVLLEINGAAPATLVGDWKLTDDSVVAFASGEVTAIGAGSELVLSGPDDARIESGATSALAKLSSVAGKLDLENGAALTTTGSLTDIGQLTVDANASSGGSQLSIGQTLTIAEGHIFQIGDSNDGITKASTVEAQTLDNNGLIEIYGGLTATAKASVVINGPAPATLEGAFQLYDNAALQYGMGSIESLGVNAQLLLDGAQAGIDTDFGTMDGLDGLTSNAGVLNLENGAGINVYGNAFTNTGAMLIQTDAQTNIASPTASASFVGLVNNDAIEVGVLGGQAVPETAIELGVSGPVTGTGFILLGSGAEARLSTVGSGQTIVMDGSDVTLGFFTAGFAANLESSFNPTEIENTAYYVLLETGITGQNYKSSEIAEDSNFLTESTTFDNNDGTHTITAVETGVTLNGAGANDTFVFAPNFGQDTITNFAATGATTHDTLSVPTADFANLAALIGDMHQVGMNTVITAHDGDSITLDNVVANTLKANTNDFKFT